MSFKFSSDRGRLLENVVFVELKRRNKKVFYSKNTYECDFVICEKDKIVEAIQVTDRLMPENEARETNGLLEAMKKFNLKEGKILTLDEEKDKVLDGKKIHILPAWKWMLK